MRRSAILAGVAVCTISTVAAAQTPEQIFSSKVVRMSAGIAALPLDTALKRGVDQRLQQIATTDAGCTSSGTWPDALDCSKSTPEQINTASQKIAKFSQQLETAAREFAGQLQQSAPQPYAEKVREQLSRIERSVIQPERSPLVIRFRDFLDTLRSSPSPASASMVEQEYQRLVQEVNTAIVLSTLFSAAKPFIEQYRDRVSAIEQKIFAARLIELIKRELNESIRLIKPPLFYPPNPAPSLSAIAAAYTTLDEFSKRVDATVATESGKSPADWFAPRINALEKKLRDAKLGDAWSRPIQLRIDQLRTTLLSPRGQQLSQQLETDRELREIESAINAAITRYQALVTKLSETRARLANWRHPYFREGYGNQINALLAEAAGPNADIVLLMAKADTLYAKVDRLGVDPYPNKVYMTLRDDLKARLQASKVPADVKAALVNRLDEFFHIRIVKQCGGKSPCEAFEVLDPVWQAIIVDIDAALRRAG